jgi:cupin fold WbuC family metalloprotein
MYEIIDSCLLDSVSAQAKEVPRLRKNHNLHASPEEPCNRLLNGIEPGSYIRPHRHLDPTKDESIVILRGVLGVIIFDESGAVIRKALLTPGSDAVAVNIRSGVFHTFVSLEENTVFFEAKAGPYKAVSSEEFASWAPSEGSTEAAAYLETFKKLW